MKKSSLIIYVAAVTALMASCGNKNNFTVNGTVDDPTLNGETVYLRNLYVNPEQAVDSCVIADGHFSLTGSAEEAWMGLLETYSTSILMAIVAEPGTITVADDSIGGTPLNDKLHQFNQAKNIDALRKEMEQQMAVYYATTDARERATAERVLDSLEALGMKQLQDASWKLYNENHDNVLALHAMQTIVASDEFSYAEFDSIVAAASPLVANDKSVQAKLQQLRAVEETSVGKHYTDIQGVDGKLSDLIDGKLALVDFYASWCGPCRFEIRDNLVPLWNKYQDKGLVIVGLNVWERGDRAAREAAHQKVMSELGITYPQLVDSTRTATNTYGVQGIPQIILIGPDGTILARDLRGAAIEEAVAKALGK